MRQLSTTTPVAEFLAAYGQDWRYGILSEHLYLFVRAGGEHHPSGGWSAGWVVVDGTAYPVLCSEIVRVDTEDGPVSGRCGERAMADTGTCEYHRHDEV